MDGVTAMARLDPHSALLAMRVVAAFITLPAGSALRGLRLREARYRGPVTRPVSHYALLATPPARRVVVRSWGSALRSLVIAIRDGRGAASRLGSNGAPVVRVPFVCRSCAVRSCLVRSCAAVGCCRGAPHLVCQPTTALVRSCLVRSPLVRLSFVRGVLHPRPVEVRCQA
jgi:hypothetical protein